MKIASDAIPLMDLTRQYASIKNEIDAAIQQTLYRGTFAANRPWQRSRMNLPAIAAYAIAFVSIREPAHCTWP